MQIKRGEKIVGIFTLLYLVIFTFYFLGGRNYEFIAYVGVVILISTLIGLTIRKTNFDLITLWGLSIWGLIHMLGGSLKVHDGVLYAWKIYPFLVGEGQFYILKFDQIVHFYGFGVAALVSYQLLSSNWAKNNSKRLLYTFSVLASSGFGALNEIVEFLAFVMIPNTGVGDLYNTGLDLIFNLMGAITAITFIYLKENYS